MSQTDKLFEALIKFPELLASFDALGIPGWTVVVLIMIATVGMVLAVREFLAWFLKTNQIADEVVRLESLVRDLQGDLKALEKTVLKTRGVAPPETAPIEIAEVKPKETESQFRLDH